MWKTVRQAWGWRVRCGLPTRCVAEECDHGFLLQDPDDMATDEECESHLGKLPRHHPLIKDGVSDEGT